MPNAMKIALCIVKLSALCYLNFIDSIKYTLIKRNEFLLMTLNCSDIVSSPDIDIDQKSCIGHIRCSICLHL